jgi:hypothetical protein
MEATAFTTLNKNKLSELKAFSNVEKVKECDANAAAQSFTARSIIL